MLGHVLEQFPNVATQLIGHGQLNRGYRAENPGWRDSARSPPTLSPAMSRPNYQSEAARGSAGGPQWYGRGWSAGFAYFQCPEPF